MSGLKALILCCVVAAYLIIIEAYSYVVAARFTSLHGDQV